MVRQKANAGPSPWRKVARDRILEDEEELVESVKVKRDLVGVEGLDLKNLEKETCDRNELDLSNVSRQGPGECREK